MRRLLIICALVGVGLTAVPALGATGAPGIDHAQALLGTWSCLTAQNNSTSMTFVHHPDGTFTMRGSVTPATGTETMITWDTFRYNSTASTWTLKSAATPAFGAYDGTAAPWTGKEWTFSGAEPLMGNDGKWHDRNVRQVFTVLGPTSFRREFQIQTPLNNWHDISEEVCTQVHP